MNLKYKNGVVRCDIDGTSECEKCPLGDNETRSCLMFNLNLMMSQIKVNERLKVEEWDKML